MADETKHDDGDKPGEPNKAQAEFQKYLKRMQAQGGIPGFMMPSGGAGWAVPPSVTMMSGGGHFAPSHHPEGSLTTRLGSTLRLGVDVLNAVLAGGVHFLNGVSGAAYGEQGYHQSCGCGDDCCGNDCCGNDCCGCECCQPGVGSCC